MNNLLTYSHHLNNMISSLSVMSKQVKDIDERLKKLEKTQPIKKEDDIKLVIKQEIENALKSLRKEDDIKLVIKQEIENELKALRKEEVESTVKTLLLTPQEDTEQELLLSVESTTLHDDDIVIEERKPNARKQSKKGSKRS